MAAPCFHARRQLALLRFPASPPKSNLPAPPIFSHPEKELRTDRFRAGFVGAQFARLDPQELAELLLTYTHRSASEVQVLS